MKAMLVLCAVLAGSFAGLTYLPLPRQLSQTPFNGPAVCCARPPHLIEELPASSSPSIEPVIALKPSRHAATTETLSPNG